MGGHKISTSRSLDMIGKISLVMWLDFNQSYSKNLSMWDIILNIICKLYLYINYFALKTHIRDKWVCGTKTNYSSPKLTIDLMHMMSRHRNRRAPPLVGGQMRHCRVRHRQACTQRANPCISHAIPPGRPGPVHQLGANALSAQHVHAARCKLDPQHGVVIGCYGEDDVNAYMVYSSTIPDLILYWAGPTGKRTIWKLEWSPWTCL